MQAQALQPPLPITPLPHASPRSDVDKLLYPASTAQPTPLIVPHSSPHTSPHSAHVGVSTGGGQCACAAIRVCVSSSNPCLCEL